MKAVTFISAGRLVLDGSRGVGVGVVFPGHEVSLNPTEEFLGLEMYHVQQYTKKVC